MQKYKKIEIDIYCIGVEIQMMQGWAVKKERWMIQKMLLSQAKKIIFIIYAAKWHLKNM